MGVRKDLKRAGARRDLADRVKVELVRGENGAVREARVAALAEPPKDGSTPADIPYRNAEDAPNAVVVRRKEAGSGGRSPPPRSPVKSPPPPRG